MKSSSTAYSWHAPVHLGAFLAAGVALGAGFAVWQGLAPCPLADRPRVACLRPQPFGGWRAASSMLIASAGLFGIFLFLTYYLQQTLGYVAAGSPASRSLPLSAGLCIARGHTCPDSC